MFIFDILTAIFRAIWSIITHTYEAMWVFLEGIIQAFAQIFGAGSPVIKGLMMSIIYGLGTIFYYALEALRFIAESIESNWDVAGPMVAGVLVGFYLKFRNRRRCSRRR